MDKDTWNEIRDALESEGVGTGESTKRLTDSMDMVKIRVGAQQAGITLTTLHPDGDLESEEYHNEQLKLGVRWLARSLEALAGLAMFSMVTMISENEEIDWDMVEARVLEVWDEGLEGVHAILGLSDDAEHMLWHTPLIGMVTAMLMETAREYWEGLMEAWEEHQRSCPHREEGDENDAE